MQIKQNYDKSKRTYIKIISIFFVIAYIFLASLGCAQNQPKEEVKSLENLYSIASESVAEVKTDNDAGTAFIIKIEQNNVYLVTNKHLFLKNGSFDTFTTTKLKFKNNKTYTGKVLGYNSYHDIAIILVEKASEDEFTPLEFASYSFLPEGREIYVIGNSLNMGLSLYLGVVSKFEQALFYEDNFNQSKRVPVIQVSAAINAGSSGGPVLDYNNKVVGVGTYQIPQYNSRPVDSMSFCVPSTIVSKIANQIIKENPLGESSASESADLLIRLSNTEDVDKFEIDFYELGFKAVKKGNYLEVTHDYDETSPTIITKVKKGDKIMQLGELNIQDANLFEIIAECMNYITDERMPPGSVTNKVLTLKIERNSLRDEIMYINKYEKKY